MCARVYPYLHILAHICIHPSKIRYILFYSQLANVHMYMYIARLLIHVLPPVEVLSEDLSQVVTVPGPGQFSGEVRVHHIVAPLFRVVWCVWNTVP